MANETRLNSSSSLLINPKLNTEKYIFKEFKKLRERYFPRKKIPIKNTVNSKTTKHFNKSMSVISIFGRHTVWINPRERNERSSQDAQPKRTAIQFFHKILFYSFSLGISNKFKRFKIFSYKPA